MSKCLPSRPLPSLGFLSSAPSNRISRTFRHDFWANFGRKQYISFSSLLVRRLTVILELAAKPYLPKFDSPFKQNTLRRVAGRRVPSVPKASSDAADRPDKRVGAVIRQAVYRPGEFPLPNLASTLDSRNGAVQLAARYIVPRQPVAQELPLSQSPSANSLDRTAFYRRPFSSLHRPRSAETTVGAPVDHPGRLLSHKVRHSVPFGVATWPSPYGLAGLAAPSPA